MKSSLFRGIIATAVGAILFVGSAVQAAAYMKLGDIKGEVTEAKHKDWIEIESWSFGATQLGGGGGGAGGGAGKTEFSDIVVTKEIDKASPLIFLACAKGQHIPEVKLEFTRNLPRKGRQPAREETYLKIELEDCLVSSYQTGGSGNEQLPTEQVSLNFSKIVFTYIYTDENGSPQEVSVSWDVQENTEL